jgi:nucleoside-diphosphate-sugar epimerase
VSRKKIIVVGGLGLIGRAIVQRLKETGWEPIIVDSQKGGDIETDLGSKEAESSLYQKLVPVRKEIGGWVNAQYPKTAEWGRYNFLDDENDDGLTNLTLHGGVFYRSCCVAVRLFQESEGGSSVNLSSIYGA